MYVTSFPSKFHGHIFISLKVISALQKREKGGTRKKQTKRKGYDTAFENLCNIVHQ